MKEDNLHQELERMGYEIGTIEYFAMLTYLTRQKEQKQKQEKEDERTIKTGSI